MKEKVLLILIDGLRPDSIHQCEHSFLKRLSKSAISTMSAMSVMPSITLPCHVSLFFSALPQKHGILTNTWTPIDSDMIGLCEVIKDNKKKTAFFYNWEEIRDLARPGSLSYSLFKSQYEFNDTDRFLTMNCAHYLENEVPDFAFLYLGQTDEIGHRFGWMSPEYLASVANVSECVESIYDQVSQKYTIIITSDHGGHEYSHGLDCDEDMYIPFVMSLPDKKKQRKVKEVFDNAVSENALNLIDIAPTITSLMGIEPNKSWEGRSFYV